MSYEPDHPLNLIFDIEAEESYTPLHALNVIIDLDEEDQSGQVSYLTPDAIFSESFGTAHIYTGAETLRPNALNSMVLGVPVIYNYWTFTRTAGWVSSLFGQLQVRNSDSVIRPTGRVMTLFGTTKAQNGKRYLDVSGAIYTRFGTTKIESSTRYVNTSGAYFFLISKPRISYKEQYVTTRQQNPSTLYGNTRIAYAVRYVEQNSNQPLTRFGKSWASHSPRYIEPRGIWQYFPTNHRVGVSRIVQMEGFDFLRFGTRIVPESQTVYPQGFGTIFGQTEIYNSTQHIKPKGFLTVGEKLDFRFGHIDIFNSDQYIKPYHDDTSRAAGPLFPEIKQHEVFNRNRKVQTHGTIFQVFGYQNLTLGARVIYPQGISSPIEQPSKSMVAHGIRYVKAIALEPPHISTWNTVWLSGKAVTTKGFAHSLYGVAKVENTRRIYRFISLGEQTLFGNSMISHAIRNVRIQEGYSIAPPVVPMPEVKLGVRYVEPRSIDSVRYGWFYAAERFTKITPHWEHKDLLGEPSIKNVTPQVRPWQFDSCEFGQHYIGLYTRYLKPDALNAQIFSRHKIGDRTQKINLTTYGILPPQISRTHKVESIGGEVLPFLIEPKGMSTVNFETDFRKYHVVTQNVLRPDSTDLTTLFGKPTVTANTVRVEPGYWEILIGTAKVEHKNRRVYVNSGKDNFLEIGSPRMSPHTIWAVKDAPQQAIDNHTRPRLPLHYVDGLDTRVTPARTKEPGIEIGIPKVSHKQRFFAVTGRTFSLFGENTALKNAQKFIEPKGQSFLRIGVLGPIGDQQISFRTNQIYTLYGRPAVSSIVKFDPIVKPSGLASFVMGNNSIELFHRQVKPVGIASLSMGARLANDKPYMWQGLRIGEHVPTRVGGEVHSMYGTTWISYRVREAVVHGNDFAVVGEYEPGKFNLKMTVYNRDQPDPPGMQIIAAKGIPPQPLLGVPDLKHAVHYIRPYGNTDNYRKGGQNAQS
ncbi:hypothetical protein [Acinetobacter sp. UBA2581]|uniref:hypothetical protein n=1 Tax=Acinetobacter sp. UBA2581 TaxID=1945932 RepID=UPI00257DEEB6|nr:hypothetical protein [Acinetobacter sp. UBA2581]